MSTTLTLFRAMVRVAALCRELGTLVDARIFRCPGDRSTVRTVTGQTLGQWRTRSYAMNGNLGGRTNENQNVVWKGAQIRRPSATFVFIDEHEDTIDDGHFLVWPAPDDRWVNLPADRHGQGCNLSFADGHVEHWRWMAEKKFEPRTSYWKRASGESDLRDLRRLQEATVFDK